MSRVTWISPDECDLRVWAGTGVPHHALDVEAGGGPGHGDVQPLHVSRVTSQLARGATCHLVAHHARVAQTVDVGGVGGQLQLLQPGHVSRVTSRVMYHVTLPGEEVLHDVWDLLRVPEQVSGHVTM